MSAAKSNDSNQPADTTSPKSWPNLGYDRLPALDYLVLEITSEDLRDAAALVESLLPHPRAPGIAEVLRCFADRPSPITEANKFRDHTPDPILGLWRALHYLVIDEMYPDQRRTKVRLGIVADLWQVNYRTIEADNGKHRERAKQILQSMVEDRSIHAAMDRSHVIAALDRDLKLKAAKEPIRGTGKISRKKIRKVTREK